MSIDQKMNLPVLVLIGGADNMGSPDIAARRWREGFAKAGNTRAQVVVIPGMGHGASIGSTHEQGGATFPAYFDAIEKFVSVFRAGVR